MPQQEQEKENITNKNKSMLQQPDIALDKAIVTRVNQRRKLSIHGTPIQYQKITPPGTKSMAMFMVLAEPTQSTGDKFLHHGGDETLLVLSGHLEVDLHDHLHDHKEKLNPGDSLFIPRGALHRVTNTGKVNAEAIFVLSPPEYTEGEH